MCSAVFYFAVNIPLFFHNCIPFRSRSRPVFTAPAPAPAPSKPFRRLRLRLRLRPKCVGSGGSGSASLALSQVVTPGHRISQCENQDQDQGQESVWEAAAAVLPLAPSCRGPRVDRRVSVACALCSYRDQVQIGIWTECDRHPDTAGPGSMARRPAGQWMAIDVPRRHRPMLRD